MRIWLLLALLSSVAGAAVDFVDTDGDGIADWEDYCPRSPKGQKVWTRQLLAKHPNVSRRFLGCVGGQVEGPARGYTPPSKEQVLGRSQTRVSSASKDSMDQEMLDLGFERMSGSFKISEVPPGTRVVVNRDIDITEESRLFSKTPHVVLDRLGESERNVLPKGSIFVVTGNDAKFSSHLGRSNYSPGGIGKDSEVLTYVRGWIFLEPLEKETLPDAIDFKLGVVISTTEMVHTEILPEYFALERRVASRTSYERDKIIEIEKVAPFRFYVPAKGTDPMEGRSGLRTQLLPHAPQKFFSNLATFFRPLKQKFLENVAESTDVLKTRGINPGLEARNYSAQLLVLSLIEPMIEETSSEYVQGPVLRGYRRGMRKLEEAMGIASASEIELNHFNAEVALTVVSNALKAIQSRGPGSDVSSAVADWQGDLASVLASLAGANRLSDQQLADIVQMFEQHDTTATLLVDSDEYHGLGLVLARCRGFFEGPRL